MVELSPSVLSCNFSNVQKDLDELKGTKVKYLHLDVMDGNFVPNISFGFSQIKDIRDKNNLIFDTHLMIEEPVRYLERFKEAGSDLITVHFEACSNLDETLNKIKSLGLKVGLSFKPKTKLEKVIPYLDKLDLILVMSVEPGFGGQKFIENSLDKIKYLRKYIDDKKLPTLIEVDGGIKTFNLKKVVEAGADIIVSGSDIFAKDDIRGQVETYYEIFNQ